MESLGITTEIHGEGTEDRVGASLAGAQACIWPSAIWE